MVLSGVKQSDPHLCRTAVEAPPPPSTLCWRRMSCGPMPLPWPQLLPSPITPSLYLPHNGAHQQHASPTSHSDMHPARSPSTTSSSRNPPRLLATCKVPEQGQGEGWAQMHLSGFRSPHAPLSPFCVAPRSGPCPPLPRSLLPVHLRPGGCGACPSVILTHPSQPTFSGEFSLGNSPPSSPCRLSIQAAGSAPFSRLW